MVKSKARVEHICPPRLFLPLLSFIYRIRYEENWRPCVFFRVFFRCRGRYEQNWRMRFIYRRRYEHSWPPRFFSPRFFLLSFFMTLFSLTLLLLRWFLWLFSMTLVSMTYDRRTDGTAALATPAELLVDNFQLMREHRWHCSACNPSGAPCR